LDIGNDKNTHSFVLMVLIVITMLKWMLKLCMS